MLGNPLGSEELCPLIPQQAKISSVSVEILRSMLYQEGKEGKRNVPEQQFEQSAYQHIVSSWTDKAKSLLTRSV